MTLYIKNMTCLRCRMTVKSILERLGLNPIIIDGGEIKIAEVISPLKWEQLNNFLKRAGFELMEPKKVILLKKIKNILDELVHYSDEQLKEVLPEYLTERLKYDYDYLSRLFSDAHSTTIEKYFTLHKIERVKELLVYYRLNLTEIAYQLNYNTIAQLTNQFKQVTGIAPTKFQKISEIRQLATVDV